MNITFVYKDAMIKNFNGIEANSLHEGLKICLEHEKEKLNILHHISITPDDNCCWFISADIKEEELSLGNILKQWLQKNGYAGLCNPKKECGCNINYLMPCRESGLNCRPGYEHKDKKGYYSGISTKKQKETKE